MPDLNFRRSAGTWAVLGGEIAQRRVPECGACLGRFVSTGNPISGTCSRRWMWSWSQTISSERP